MSESILSHLTWARISFFSGMTLSGVLLLFTLLLSAEKLEIQEKLPRDRWLGMAGGWIALILCIDHAAVVAPAFLLPLLWPLAIIVPVLGFFFVDYPCARALGGLLILQGYCLVHYTFDFSTPGFPAAAVVGWLTGIAGIWLSAKPCAMRDYIRRGAHSAKFRLGTAAAWGIVFIISLWALLKTEG